MSGSSQAVRLPKEYRFDVQEVLIRREGTRVILEPPPEQKWPARFWNTIRIDDPSFVRPAQDVMPPVPTLDEET